jgi:predicted nuclease of predicted toxin-antitoxin system
VLLDENLPRKLTRLFGLDMEVVTVREHGWSSKKNGELLAAASGEFDVCLTADRGIPNQQNLARYGIAVLILEARSNTLEDLAPLVSKTVRALRSA